MIKISQVLCPVDFSEYSHHALTRATALAKWYEARLTVLHVFVNMGAVDLPPIVLEEDERTRLLSEMRRLAGPPQNLLIDFRVREAPDVHREILSQAALLGADLLVIGSHGRKGFERLLLGSVTEKVLRRAECPVLVVPRSAPDAEGAPPAQFDSILCPVDFSDASLTALTYALSIAQEADATLTVLHAIEIPPELKEPPGPPDFNVDAVRAAAEAEALRHLRELVPAEAKTYCTVETLALEGAAYRQILKVAAERQTDLIVMGVQGRGAMDLLVFGSNTARVTRAAPCPVLVVRKPQ